MPRIGDKHHTPIGKKKAGWYINLDLLDEFKDKCKSEGRAQSDVLHELMSKYLNQP